MNGGGGNRRNRRRRGGGAPRAIMPGGVRIVDTEVLPLTAEPDKLGVVQFCPGSTGLVRLDNEANKFGRWTLLRVVFTYQPTASLSDSGSITYGILPGPLNSSVTKDTITKLKPFQKHSLWKSSSITVSRNIMMQMHMLTGKVVDTPTTTEDMVGFCFYYTTTKPSLGVLRVSYEVVLNFPKP